MPIIQFKFISYALAGKHKVMQSQLKLPNSQVINFYQLIYRIFRLIAIFFSFV